MHHICFSYPPPVKHALLLLLYKYLFKKKPFHRSCTRTDLRWLLFTATSTTCDVAVCIWGLRCLFDVSAGRREPTTKPRSSFGAKNTPSSTFQSSLTEGTRSWPR